ncbi:MAG TPA: class I SAM-dependent methyltransferase [Candidatus Limnocylindrales bacterium]|nr:class I SAM-dependent methyltransferase [Candidatus Limnocylindrales bacterium]
MKAKPDLSGVPETALWTLWFRAVATRRGDGLLEDPMAVGLVERIDYPFEERFGAGFQFLPQIQALRVLTFDAQVKQFLRDHPRGTVVALGEGLETQFWRLDNGSVHWLTVDLPDSVALRRRLLPMGERQQVFAGSALDPKWTELVDPAHGVMITAQGLLMYLEPERVRSLISLCANAFPGGTLVFDALPPWMAKAVLHVAGPFKPPPLPWTLRPKQLRDLKAIDPAIERVVDVRPERGRGLLGRLAPNARRIPIIAANRPVIVALRFRS